MKFLFTFASFAILTFVTCVQAAASALVVHEWGTFTCLQDEQGNALDGVNVDDEPLPQFVYNIGNLISPGIASFKGVPRLLPGATMRLETPVIYFYPEDRTPFNVDVHVTFRGGWLTQFYPKATKFETPGLTEKILNAETTGTLAWDKLRVGENSNGPQTDSAVWLAPRAVDAVSVRTQDGEAERYLFYRGIGHLDAPMRVIREDNLLHFQSAPELAKAQMLLVEIRPDLECAFRVVNAQNPCPAAFEPSAFSKRGLEDVSEVLRKMLVADGLYPKEAAAMLNTWRHSYFQQPGLRLFFLAPLGWTDEVLPLEISRAAEIDRVMVGRIELVTPEQREVLKKLPLAFSPEDYLKLGRFRDALIADEQKKQKQGVNK